MALSKRKIKRRSNDTHNYGLLVVTLRAKIRKITRQIVELKGGMNAHVGSFANPKPVLSGADYTDALSQRSTIKKERTRLKKIHRAPARNSSRLGGLAAQYY